MARVLAATASREVVVELTEVTATGATGATATGATGTADTTAEKLTVVPEAAVSMEEGLTAVTETAAAGTEAEGLTEATADASDPSAGNRAPRLTPGRADRILRERCPACFAHEEWGRPFDQYVGLTHLHLILT